PAGGPADGSFAGGGPDVLGQVDDRAVAPEPLEGVELALVLVLDVHDDVAVVDEDPAPVALALATDRLGAELAERALDGVDDRLDLAVVARGGDEEGVGDRELLAHVEGDDLGRLLVGGGAGGGAHELEGVVGGCHGATPWTVPGTESGPG